jgi:Ion channel
MARPRSTLAQVAGAARHYEWLRRRGMVVLLALLVLSVFILPGLISGAEAWHVTVDVLLTLALVSGVVAIVDHGRLAIVLALLCALVIALRLLEWTDAATLPSALRNTSIVAAFLVLALAVGINVFSKGQSLAERVAGAVVLYLLVGLIWAYVYMLVNRLVPNAFAYPAADATDFPEWVYFSFVTLTTVGYGDITPVARGARSLATLEAFVGQLYPAIIIARFVSLPAKT